MKAKRLAEILNYVSQKGICSYEELCDYYKMSVSTIRRDIAELIQSGAMSKTHGGVIAAQTMDGAVSYLDQLKMSASPFMMDNKKRMIAQRASQLVEDNDIIFLGSGTTVACMVSCLKDRRGLFIITNNLLVLNEAQRYSLNTMVIGGNLNIDTMSIVGIQSIKQIHTLNANKAFLGCNGITLSCSVTNVSEVEADIKKEAMTISDESYLLTDSLKFGKMSLHTFAGLDEFHGTITDTPPSQEFLDVFQRINQRLMIAL